MNEGCEQWDKAEFLQLAYIKIAQAAELLTKVGEDNLAEEAEALADKVDRTEAQASITPPRREDRADLAGADCAPAGVAQE